MYSVSAPNVCACVRAYKTWQERMLSMFCTCQEQTHLLYAVHFGLSFGLVIFENPEILPKIMGVVSIRFWHWNYFWNHLFVTKVCSFSKPHTFQSTLHTQSVDHLNIDGPSFPLMFVRKFGFTLGGEVTKRGACVRSFMRNRVCMHLCLYI